MKKFSLMVMILSLLSISAEAKLAKVSSQRDPGFLNVCERSPAICYTLEKEVGFPCGAMTRQYLQVHKQREHWF